MNEYAPALIDYQYDFSKVFRDCPFMVLERIDATASPDNIASWKLLDKLGFSSARTELPVLEDDSLIPESGPYNIRIIENTIDQQSGQPMEFERVRTVEKKYFMIKWHFMKLMSCGCPPNAETNQGRFQPVLMKAKSMNEALRSRSDYSWFMLGKGKGLNSSYRVNLNLLSSPIVVSSFFRFFEQERPLIFIFLNHFL